MDGREAACRVLRHPAVAAKTFLIAIGDRTVGGLCSRDPFVGPWQVPVADCAVTLLDYDGYAGEAYAIGERTSGIMFQLDVGTDAEGKPATDFDEDHQDDPTEDLTFIGKGVHDDVHAACFVDVPGALDRAATHAHFVSDGYFPVLGLHPAQGAGLPTGASASAESQLTAVISDAMWEDAFARKDVSNRTIMVNGVAVSVIVPGRITDQRWVRLASRRMWGELLEAGVRIYEYKPAMTHAKVLIVDELWTVLGTTNIDNRSFEHNDEINVALRDPQVAARLLQDYEQDLRDSEEVTHERWRRRPLWEKVVGPFVWILERQQ
jgi:hypothetical protein